MKRVIRSNCFETNSSSVHAIVIDRRSELQTPDPCGIGFTLGEFEWEWETYSGTDSRASYLWTAIICNYGDDLVDGVANYRTEPVLGWMDYLKSAIHRKFGDNVEPYFQFPNKNSWFGIDHSYALGGWLEHLREDEDDLLSYLFGEGSVIRTGNDNDDGSVDTSCPDGGYVYVKRGG